MRLQKLQILPMSPLQPRRQLAVGQTLARTPSISLISRRAFWGGAAFGAITFAVHLSGVIFSSVLGAPVLSRFYMASLLHRFLTRNSELRLGGWSKIGFPGVIVVEGGEM